MAVDNGSADLIYLPDRRAAAVTGCSKRMRAAAAGTTGVQEALYREPNPRDGGEQLHRRGRASGLELGRPAQRRPVRHRRGRLRVLRGNPGSNPLVGNHGAPHTRDNFLAVIGGGQLVRQRTLADDAAPDFDDTEMYPRQAENVDVAPTVMRLFGLRPPKDSRGRFLRQAFRPGQLVEADR